ncbi:copper chaperone [Scopulibacillus darangshiensis]|uniref:Copper chaperone CopZ n=1 Tax=Scopulibacillus darangshiensis TaxID=442528 RepID=A0A4R2NYB2_9BACL|nr:copper chaperone CopZ [Scopulibacillus darangshiensis]TCP26614.1 copper chaperone [Scopulibacillus darangshiensis]
MEKATINVKGMTCGHCEAAVTNALKELSGVSEVKVHLDNGKVDVTFHDGKVSFDQMKEAIEDQGYDVV